MKNVLGMEFLLLAIDRKVFENIGKPISTFKVERGEYKIKTDYVNPYYGNVIVYIKTSIWPKGHMYYNKKTDDFSFKGKKLTENVEGDVWYHNTTTFSTIHDRGHGITHYTDEELYLPKLQKLCWDNLQISSYRGRIQICPLETGYWPEKFLCRELYNIFVKMFYDYRIGNYLRMYPSTLDDQRRDFIRALFPKQYDDALEYEKDLRGGNLMNPPIPSGMYKLTKNSQELREFCTQALKDKSITSDDYYLPHPRGTVWVRNRGQGQWSEAYLINVESSHIKKVIDHYWHPWGESCISQWKEVIDSTTVLT